jgi:hypothetical protein
MADKVVRMNGFSGCVPLGLESREILCVLQRITRAVIRAYRDVHISSS